MKSTGAIVIEGLTKTFGDNHVLKGVNLSVEKGTILALLGPNGVGKTTTIRILSTLLKPDAGRALVNGFDVVADAERVRESIGLTGQYAAVDEYLTARENLEMFGRLYRLSFSDSRRRAEELLVQFDLLEAAERAVKTYSGGMRRRLDLALSLVATPPVLFLDEPTTGLDPRSRQAMWKVIKQLVDADVTILLTTQYLEEADQLADRIAVIDHGRIIAEGTASELKGRVGKERLEIVLAPESDFVRACGVLQAEGVLVDASARSISLPVEGGAGEIKRVLDLMEREKIMLVGISMHRPTLDDVFLRLTGHKADIETGVQETP